MSEVARELRALALALDETCRRSPVNSMAYEYVRHCTDYLTLRAHVIELEERTPSPPEVSHAASRRDPHR